MSRTCARERPFSGQWAWDHTSARALPHVTIHAEGKTEMLRTGLYALLAKQENRKPHPEIIKILFREREFLDWLQFEVL